ncbi:hypothetical protein AVEN_184591-1, partial [Araneus ventricosus]
AELFFAFLEKDKIKIGNNLFLQSSCFGYLVSGNISDDNFDISTKYCFLTKNLEALNKTLSNFWEIEDADSQKTCNSEELNYCNEHFVKTHFRKADGKKVVSMPLKPEFPETMLGNSKMIASVAEGEDGYYPKEDAGASNITNKPFIYNRLKPILTRIHANSRNPNNWIR